MLLHQQVSPLKKFYMIYSFFLVRRLIAPTVAFVLYNIIIPVSVMIPEVFLPIWGVAYIPTALTIVTAIRIPELVSQYLHYSSDRLLILLPWILKFNCCLVLYPALQKFAYHAVVDFV